MKICRRHRSADVLAASVGEPYINGMPGSMARLPGIIQGIAWEQVVSVAILFAIMRLIGRRRLADRYILGGSLAGSFALWPNVVAVYSSYVSPETSLSFFGIPDASSPGIYALQLVMSDILLVVLLNQYALFAAVLVIPAALLAGAPHVRYRQLGCGLFLAVLPLSWVLALLNEAPW